MCNKGKKYMHTAMFACGTQTQMGKEDKELQRVRQNGKI
jgi:hypothetical protein